MAENYHWNIIRVGVEVSCGSKVFKMGDWDVQNYPLVPKTVHFQPQVIQNPNQTVHFQPQVIQNPNHNCFEHFLNHYRFYFSSIKDWMTIFFFSIHESTLRALKVNI